MTTHEVAHALQRVADQAEHQALTALTETATDTWAAIAEALDMLADELTNPTEDEDDPWAPALRYPTRTTPKDTP